MSKRNIVMQNAVFLFSVLTLMIFSVDPSRAADAPPSTQSAPRSSAQSEQSKEDDDVSGLLPQNQQIVQEVGPSYTSMTYANLFRLAWALGGYDNADKDALDNYLKVTECNLYQKYYNNEFEWEKIRQAAKDYLDKHGQKKEPYFEYIQPLLLGRYDNALEGFPLQSAADYLSLKTLQIADFKTGYTSCGQFNIDAMKYPSAGILNLISPLSFTFVRVPKKVAEQYISWRAEQGYSDGNERLAYIRYRVRVDSLVGKRKVEGGNSYIFNGRLMQIDVFADKEMLMPLYNQLF